MEHLPKEEKMIEDGIDAVELLRGDLEEAAQINFALRLQNSVLESRIEELEKALDELVGEKWKH